MSLIAIEAESHFGVINITCTFHVLEMREALRICLWTTFKGILLIDERDLLKAHLLMFVVILVVLKLLLIFEIISLLFLLSLHFPLWHFDILSEVDRLGVLSHVAALIHLLLLPRHSLLSEDIRYSLHFIVLCRLLNVIPSCNA